MSKPARENIPKTMGKLARRREEFFLLLSFSFVERACPCRILQSQRVDTSYAITFFQSFFMYVPLFPKGSRKNPFLDPFGKLVNFLVVTSGLKKGGIWPSFSQY